VKNKALDELLNLETKQKEIFLSRLIKLAKQRIKFDVVYCNNSDLKFIKTKISNAKIKTDDINGLMFESEDGSEILDLRFEIVSNYIFEKYEDKIQEVLF
jgi:vacuolar-type H+-ATPase subunit E/Vma4